jgi:hypothetical protein
VIGHGSNAWADGAPAATQDAGGWAIDRPENYPEGGAGMTDEFQEYEVPAEAGEAGYESVYDDDGRYIPDEDEQDLLDDALEPYYDEYGDLDPDALERLRERVIETGMNQAQIAEAQEQRQLEQIYLDLERQYPILADEAGVQHVWQEACRLHNIDPNDEAAFDEFLHRPDVVADAALSVSGGDGQFLRMHAESQNPEHAFWGVSGGPGGIG